MIVRGFACQARGGRAGGLTDDERRTEIVNRVGYYQGLFDTPALIAAHWDVRLRRAYLAGYRRGRDDLWRERASTPSRCASRPSRPSRSEFGRR